MRSGCQSVLNIDTLIPAWKKYGLSAFFDMSKCTKEGLKDFLTPEENRMFSVSPYWSIIVLYNFNGEFTDDQTVQMVIDEIIEAVGTDVWDQWEKIYVKNTNDLASKKSIRF